MPNLPSKVQTSERSCDPLEMALRRDVFRLEAGCVVQDLSRCFRADQAVVGVSRSGRILERAKEAAAVRTRDLAEAPIAASPTAPVETPEPEPDVDMCAPPTALQTSAYAAVPSSGPFVMPFALVSLSDDPFDFPATQQYDDSEKSPDINAAAPPSPIHAGSIDINVGAGNREQSEPLSTPELSPGPSRYATGSALFSGRHPEPCWSDDLFGSETDPSEAEVRE